MGFGQDFGQGFGQGFGSNGSTFGSSTTNQNVGSSSSSSPFATATSTGGVGGGTFLSGFGSSSNVTMSGGGGFGSSPFQSSKIGDNLVAPPQSSSMVSSSPNNFGSGSSVMSFGKSKGNENNVSRPPTNPSPFSSSPNVAIPRNSNNNKNNNTPFSSVNGGNVIKQGISVTPFGNPNGNESFGGTNLNNTTNFGQAFNNNMMEIAAGHQDGTGIKGGDSVRNDFQQIDKQKHHADQVFIPRSKPSNNNYSSTSDIDITAADIGQRKATLDEQIAKKREKMEKIKASMKSREIAPVVDSATAQDGKNNRDRVVVGGNGLGTEHSKVGGERPPLAPPITHKNAKSLIGTCLHMCPDEERERREEEGDLQLLELPFTSEGGVELHPKGWTLRDTAVKRFRRSAADYNLAIPELIRPPFVLERVCGYLEEWVMERDRQGPDPRLEGNKAPTPIDVYQFIWDRTRMVRKDFILQNYTAGGKCSAAAVRCHERIARWHAMVEHQLSHIPEFVKMQSQQNIQELGQTLKSLNYYYDDVERRSTVEEEGSNDNDNPTIIHGCRYHRVMGGNPVDYDGKTLNNHDDDLNNNNRIIGCLSPENGTAEPEMRGLYILLTLNLDGGMEVMKYAGRLSLERPKVFRSKLVQLALEVYKAKKEHNYARFFSILRSESTPYLFACIMFKYVEQMRKVAFRIMSKTYGARRKDTGEGFKDSYPLANLVKLLCFEDLEEATNACRHYNIRIENASLLPSSAAKETMTATVNPNQQEDTILWRALDFKEASCPKGLPLPFVPQKMTHTIEKKVNGVTRLGICRGHRKISTEQNLKIKFQLKRRKREEEEARKLREGEAAARKIREEEEAARKIREEAAARKIREEAAARKIREEAATRKIREAAAARKMREEARKRKEEAKKKEEEKEKLRAEQIKRDEERIREAELMEQKRKVAERKWQSKIDIAKKIFIMKKWQTLVSEKKKRREKEEEERKTAEKKKRDEQIQKEMKDRLRRVREEVEAMERKAKEEIEMRWKVKIDIAKKIFVMKKWQAMMSKKKYKRESTQISLGDFDPIGQKRAFSFLDSPQQIYKMNKESVNNLSGGFAVNNSFSHEDLYYQLGTNSSRSIDLSEILLSKLSNRNNLCSLQDHTVILFKLAVIIIGEKLTNSGRISKLIQMWINSRLQFNVVLRTSFEGTEVRTVAVCHDLHSTNNDGFDAILLVIPPTNTQDVGSQVTNSSMTSCIDYRVPYLVLRLDNCKPRLMTHLGIDKNDHHQFNEECGMSESGAFDEILSSGCEALIQDFTNSIDTEKCDFTASAIEAISVQKLCCMAMRQALWEVCDNVETLPTHLQREAFNRSEEKIVEQCRDALTALVQELIVLGNDVKHGYLSCWPASEFLNPTTTEVPSYFAGNKGLPKDWKQFLNPTRLKEIVLDMFPCIIEPKPVISVLEELLYNSPLQVRQMCGEMFKDKRTKSCFDTALQWLESTAEKNEACMVVYVPKGKVANLIDRAVNGLIQETFRDTLSTLPEAKSSKVENILSTTDESSEIVLQDNAEMKRTRTLSSTLVSHVEKRRNKRSMSSFLNSKKTIAVGVDLKRQKTGDKRLELGHELSQSKLYTAKLKAFLNGDITIDAGIGNTTLADILSHDCQDVITDR